MKIEASTVTEVINSIKKSLETEFYDLTVLGEVSNLSGSAAGHFYFTLSDDQSSISCAMFKMDALRNPLIRKLKNGDKIYLRGPLSLYARRGTFQIIGKKIIPFGKGDLKAQFELLKNRLKMEGYFDIDIKKPIPKYPQKIAVITALKGAVLQDFLNVMKRRSLHYNIVIIPALVQGDQCPSSVISGLKKAQKVEGVDLIVITRGGGSLEDLWGFNDEKLVKEVFACEIPVISAVGHQVDVSLCDYVSDLRCETPTAAAEIISQPQTQMKDKLNFLLKSLNGLFVTFQNKVIRRIQKVSPIRILHIIKENLYAGHKELEKLNILSRHDLIGINEKHQYLDDSIEGIRRNLESILNQTKIKLTHMDSVMKTLNPHNVLERGYTYLSHSKEGVISSTKSFDQIPEEGILSISFSDGSRKVKKVKK